MSGLEHVVIFELAFLPYESAKEKLLATLTRPMHYSGCFVDLRQFVRSGKFLFQKEVLIFLVVNLIHIFLFQCRWIENVSTPVASASLILMVQEWPFLCCRHGKYTFSVSFQEACCISRHGRFRSVQCPWRRNCTKSIWNSSIRACCLVGMKLSESLM